MTPKRFFIYAVLGLLGIYLLIKFIKWAYNFSVKRRQAYLNSEYYLFQKVIKVLKGENKKAFFEYLTLWMLYLDLKEQSFDYFLKTHGTDNLKSEYNNFVEALFNTDSKSPNNFNELLLALKASRKQYFEGIRKDKQHTANADWLNPTN